MKKQIIKGQICTFVIAIVTIIIICIGITYLTEHQKEALLEITKLIIPLAAVGSIFAFFVVYLPDIIKKKHKAKKNIETKTDD